MNRYIPIPIAVAGLLLAGTLVACSGNAIGSPSATSPTTASGGAALNSATQRSEGGQVTVEATWNGTVAGATFDVKLDTHSVDLDALDLSTAILRNDRGDQLAARPWAAPKGGHHREGALTFNGDASSFFVSAKWIELAFTGVGDIPQRNLRWEIGS
jgi:hypothetical protein